MLYPGSKTYPGSNTFPGEPPPLYGLTWLADDFSTTVANLAGKTASSGAWTATGINEGLAASSVTALTTGGKLVSSTSVRSELYYVNAAPPSADYAASVSFIALNQPATSYVSVLGRYSSSALFIEGFLLNGSTLRLAAATTAGTILAPDVSIPVPIVGSTHTLELCVVRNRAILKYDGMSMIDFHDNRLPTAPGYPGCGGPGNLAYNVDAFVAKTLTPQIPVAAFGVSL